MQLRDRVFQYFTLSLWQIKKYYENIEMGFYWLR